MDTWLVVLIGIEMVFVAFVIWLVVHYRQKRQDRRAEDRLRLVERFESGEAFSEFLHSEGGQQLMSLFHQRKPNPRAFWIVSIYAGILSLSLSAGFFFLYGMNVWGDGETFLVPGALTFSTGFGLLIAAWFARGVTSPPADLS